MGRAPTAKPTRCPKCGGTEFALIVYGLVRPSKVRNKLDSGEIALGGCIVTGNDPEWRCNTCGKRFPEDADEQRKQRLL
jgi:hypothetical protein